jgi:hypothetical protein
VLNCCYEKGAFTAEDAETQRGAEDCLTQYPWSNVASPSDDILGMKRKTLFVDHDRSNCYQVLERV